jgi:hypothetical protein
MAEDDILEPHLTPKQRLRRRADENGGQFTPWDAAECGVSKDQLHRMAKSGEVQRLFYGVYRFVGLILDAWACGQAALTSLGDDAALSHEWAAAAHRVPGYRFPTEPTVSLARRVRPRVGMTLYVVDQLEPCDVQVVNGLRVTTGTRTASICPSRSVWPATAPSCCPSSIR